MRMLPQALEIIFEVQRKKNNEKITRRKLSFSTYKMIFFLFLLFGRLLLSKLLTFSFLVILNDLKCYRSAIFSFINHLSTVITTEQHTNNFWGVWKPAL